MSASYQQQHELGAGNLIFIFSDRQCLCMSVASSASQANASTCVGPQQIQIQQTAISCAHQQHQLRPQQHKRPRLSTARHQQHLESVSALSGRTMHQQQQQRPARVMIAPLVAATSATTVLHFSNHFSDDCDGAASALTAPSAATARPSAS